MKAIESQHGILVERAVKIYSFSHLTFQEYYTAKHITDNLAQGTLEQLFGKFDDRWREVLLSVASLLDNADDFFMLFSKRINQSILEDEKLITLLRWANEKAQYTSKSLKYPSVVLGRALSLVLLMSFARALANSRLIAHLQAYPDSGNTPVYKEHIVALDKAVTLFRTLDIDLATRKGTAEARKHDRELVHDMSVAIQIHKSTKYANIDKALLSLTFVGTENDKKSWTSFNKRVDNLVPYGRNLGEAWDLDSPQFIRLNNYIDLVLLFLDCLRVAYVSDRSEIENRLLLPPN